MQTRNNCCGNCLGIRYSEPHTGKIDTMAIAMCTYAACECHTAKTTTNPSTTDWEEKNGYEWDPTLFLLITQAQGSVEEHEFAETRQAIVAHVKSLLSRKEEEVREEERLRKGNEIDEVMKKLAQIADFSHLTDDTRTMATMLLTAKHDHTKSVIIEDLQRRLSEAYSRIRELEDAVEPSK